MTLEPTYGSFDTIGMVTGLSNERSFTEGQKDGNNPWVKINFGVKVSDRAFVYVELMGSKTPNVKIAYRDPMTKKFNKEDSLLIPWESRYNPSRINYEIHMPVRLNLNESSSDESILTSYDAACALKENLNDSDIVYVHGNLQFSEYEGKSKETYCVTSLSKIKEMNKVNYKPVASFTQDCVFLNCNKDDEKLLIDTYIICRKNGDLTCIPYTFVARCIDLIEHFENNITYGSLIKVHGNIHNRADIVKIDGQLVVKGIVKELEIKGGNLLEKDKYTEADLTSISKESIFATQGTGFGSIEEDPFG